MNQLTPLEIKTLKNKARSQGVEIYSIWTNEIRESRKPSSVRDYTCKSNLPKAAIIAVLVPFFQAQGYTGKVTITKSIENYWKVTLSTRLQYVPKEAIPYKD